MILQPRHIRPRYQRSDEIPKCLGPTTLLQMLFPLQHGNHFLFSGLAGFLFFGPGDPEAFAFPTASGLQGLDFSFAGLKTALLYRVRELGETEATRRRADLAASYQRAIVEALASRVERALSVTGLQRLAVGGGVAANGPLRKRLASLGVELDIPAPALCTDNAAMIASAARFVDAIPYPHYLDLDVYASGERMLAVS